MITWRSKPVQALFALLCLAGCDDIATATLFSPTRQAAFQQTDMVGGAVTLVAPAGFCIDRSALKPQFALLARCDALGSQASTGSTPIGVIAVSVTPAPGAVALPSAGQIATASGLGAPRNTQSSRTRTIFRSTGPAPVDGMSDTQWRGAALVGGYLLGVALYGPEGGRAVSGEGSKVVSALIEGTASASQGQ